MPNSGHLTITPWKINMEPTVITHLEGRWSEPNLHEDMFQPLIFRGVINLPHSYLGKISNFD